MITIDLNHIEIASGHRILDIGCGEGRHTAAAFEQRGCFCVGADMNFKNLLTSREKLKLHEEWTGATDSSWSLSTADICRLPFKTNSFDTVICSEVMEHIPDESAALEELKRVLKPGGTLAISVPRYWPEKICWLLSDEYHLVNQGHIRIYRQREVREKVTQLGFKLFKSHFAHSLHSPFWWLKCLIGPRRTNALPVTIYHRFLVWDLMEKPPFTRFLDRLLNPIMGKSMVFYFRKEA